MRRDGARNWKRRLFEVHKNPPGMSEARRGYGATCRSNMGDQRMSRMARAEWPVWRREIFVAWPVRAKRGRRPDEHSSARAVSSSPSTQVALRGNSMTLVPHARNGHRCAVASRACKTYVGTAREMVRLRHDGCDAGHSASGSLRARFGCGPECRSRSPSQSRLHWPGEQAPNVRNRHMTRGFGSHSDTGSITG
jgi:hypothetical protein